MFLRWLIKSDVLHFLTSNLVGSIAMHGSQCWCSVAVGERDVVENGGASVMVVVRGEE